MNKIYYFLSLGLCLFFFQSCETVLLGEEEENSILNNYDFFGQEFQERYGIFKVKGLDWPALVASHRTILESDPTEEKLYEVLTSLIDELDDGHVFLAPLRDDLEFYDGGIYGRLERAGYVDFDYNTVKSDYVQHSREVDEEFLFGKLEGNIGYFYLSNIPDDISFIDELMAEVLDSLDQTKGIVIDVRDNSGGEDEGSRRIASYFVSERSLFQITRYKDGPDPDNFEEPRMWYVEPNGIRSYDKPVALLTNRYSISAAETFSLALKTSDAVTQVGDTTAGAFSDVIIRELPNAWVFGISVGDYRNAENVSLESVGLAPEIRIVNTPEDLEAKQDKMLEKAIELLK